MFRFDIYIYITCNKTSIRVTLNLSPATATIDYQWNHEDVSHVPYSKMC